MDLGSKLAKNEMIQHPREGKSGGRLDYPSRNTASAGKDGAAVTHGLQKKARNRHEDGIFQIPGNPDMTNPPPSLHCRP